MASGYRLCDVAQLLIARRISIRIGFEYRRNFFLRLNTNLSYAIQKPRSHQ